MFTLSMFLPFFTVPTLNASLISYLGDPARVRAYFWGPEGVGWLSPASAFWTN